jgi:hypothetical protein
MSTCAATTIQTAIKAHRAAWNAFGDAIDAAGAAVITPSVKRTSAAEERVLIALLATPASGRDAMRKRRYVLDQLRQFNFDPDRRHIAALLAAGDRP